MAVARLVTRNHPLYQQLEDAALADEFEVIFEVASAAKRQDFVKMLTWQKQDNSTMAMAHDILKNRRLTRGQEQSIMVLAAYCLGATVRAENALPYTFKALKVDRASVEYDDIDGYSASGETSSMTTSNVDQAAGIAKLQFLVNHVIETIAANSVSTKRDCYYMLKNQFQKYPWMDMNGQGESDRLIDALERITRLQRENVNIIADPKGLIYGDITIVDEEGKEFLLQGAGAEHHRPRRAVGDQEVRRQGRHPHREDRRVHGPEEAEGRRRAEHRPDPPGRPAGPGLPGADQAALGEGRPHRRAD